jgi:hypothetical protein
MHQQLWGYKVEWKSVSRGTGGKKVEYHWSRGLFSKKGAFGFVYKLRILRTMTYNEMFINISFFVKILCSTHMNFYHHILAIK